MNVIRTISQCLDLESAFLDNSQKTSSCSLPEWQVLAIFRRWRTIILQFDRY